MTADAASAAEPQGTAATQDSWVSQLTELAAGMADHPAKQAALDLASRAPASYRERTPPGRAALDAIELTQLADTPTDGMGPVRFAVTAPFDQGDGSEFHIRRFARTPIDLTALLPLVQSFGLSVEEAVHNQLDIATAKVSFDDLWVRVLPTTGPVTESFTATVDGDRLVEALGAVTNGRADLDPLNALVTTAGLTWPEVTILRAYARYHAQSAVVVPAADVISALVAYPGAARALIDRFAARFSPDRAERAERAEEKLAVDAFEAELAAVPALRVDRALRTCMSLVEATLRTNAYRTDRPGGVRPPALALKIDSHLAPELPAPRPHVEIWVHGPAVEGVHLRAGPVARGGLRWSDRAADFRMEVLDLMVAQVKKNAVIVPTGAKGGFVVRTVERPTPEDVAAAYEIFVRSLLDVTDNLVAGQVVGPPQVTALDGHDPYLVVAADRGTAELSDLANSISRDYGFWLGDAFASGGSRGFNHKAMGITARGAWVAVRRHFHQLGIDVQTEPFSVVGVGDMSGDVFGNGMLCSHAIRLVAAFDHRHIFLDPDPDPEVSFAERRRLAALSRSSWDDYDRTLLSEGGGVWARDAKVVPLSDGVRRALGVTVESLTPPQLVTAILEAPIDLLWLAGIGTFVKAQDESDADVADHANDEVRITAERLRARVVAEGGNLGLTQRARIRYSRRGGRVNADFIDNAAGVATSDREVNLKILCARAAEAGRLDTTGRDELLQASEPEVATEVLRQVDHSVAGLNLEVADGAGRLEAYAALIDRLESEGMLDRQVEALPSTQEIEVRRTAGAGLIRPELAVLLAYAKSELADAIGTSRLVNDPLLAPRVAQYFPEIMRRELGDLIDGHRLHGPILATEMAAEIVDHLGVTWAHETAAELGRELTDVAAAYWAAREVTEVSALWFGVDGHWPELSADEELALLRSSGDAVAALARVYLRRRRDGVDLAGLASRDRATAVELAASVSAAAGPARADGADGSTGADGPLPQLQALASGVMARAGVGDIVPIVRGSGRTPLQAANALALVDAAAGTATLSAALQDLVPGDRWRGWFIRSLLDDLGDWRRWAATDALNSVAADQETADAVARWAAVHASTFEQVRQMAVAVGAGADPVSVVAVALRRLPTPTPTS